MIDEEALVVMTQAEAAWLFMSRALAWRSNQGMPVLDMLPHIPVGPMQHGLMLLQVRNVLSLIWSRSAKELRPDLDCPCAQRGGSWKRDLRRCKLVKLENF